EFFFHECRAEGAVMKCLGAGDKSRHLALTVIDSHDEFRRARRRLDIDLLISDASPVEPGLGVPAVRAPGRGVDFYCGHYFLRKKGVEILSRGRMLVSGRKPPGLFQILELRNDFGALAA